VDSVTKTESCGKPTPMPLVAPRALLLWFRSGARPCLGGFESEPEQKRLGRDGGLSRAQRTRGNGSAWVEVVAHTFEGGAEGKELLSGHLVEQVLPDAGHVRPRSDLEGGETLVGHHA
jgi:hypothetical protein